MKQENGEPASSSAENGEDKKEVTDEDKKDETDEGESKEVIYKSQKIYLNQKEVTVRCSCNRKG